MHLVFDLEGTLVSTREANRRAYMLCGVTPPDDFHIRPWQEWCTRKQHEDKQDVLPGLMREHIALLPCFYVVYSKTGGLVLTNAAERSLNAICDAMPVIRTWTIYPEHTPEMKLSWLKSRPTGVYFDDNTKLIEKIRRETRWQTVDVSEWSFPQQATPSGFGMPDSQRRSLG